MPTKSGKLESLTERVAELERIIVLNSGGT
jgi:hypothetical protein